MSAPALVHHAGVVALDHAVLALDLVEVVHRRLELPLVVQQRLQRRVAVRDGTVVELLGRLLADRVARPRPDAELGDRELDLLVELRQRRGERVSQRRDRFWLHVQLVLDGRRGVCPAASPWRHRETSGGCAYKRFVTLTTERNAGEWDQ